MTPGQQAEAKVAEFGIRDASDLDVVAIARDANMRVRWAELDGCSATLVGFGGHAIATVRRSGSLGRDRFSVGHELGHWELHRGQSFRCRVDEPDFNLESSKPREREADEYASHILMPSFLFNPAVKAIGTPSFVELSQLAETFNTSLLATSLRLVAVDTLPVVVATYDASRLVWRRYAPHVPERWWLHDELDADSFAYDVIHKQKPKRSLGKQSADTWFANDDADRYEVHEAAIPGRAGQVLVLLYLQSKMMDARFDPNVGERRYTSEGSYVKRRK